VLPALAEERVLRVDGGVAVRQIESDGLEIYYRATNIVLVRGQWSEDVLEGEAFRILDDCAPLSYPVRGVVSSAGRLVVVGTAAETCSTQPSGVLAVMRFEAPAEPLRKAAKRREGKREARREEPRRKVYEARAQAPERRRIRVRYSPPSPQYAQQPGFGFFSQGGGWRW
jgi:hypothetical protein